MKQHLDFETRSEVDLTEVGAWAYALHPSTQITCIGFGDSRASVKVLGGWDGAAPFDLINSTQLSAHNAPFEYAIWNLILHRRFGWPDRWDPKGWRCTMAKAAACGLPLGLDPVGRVLQIKTPKDLEGRSNMLALSKPLYTDALFGPTYNESPAAYERLYAYNRIDLYAEMEVDEGLPDLEAAEQRIWELDLEMNRRGIAIDLDFARKGAALALPLVDKLNTRLHRITCTTPAGLHTIKSCNGVDKATRVAAMVRHLAERYNVITGSLDKEAVTVLLEDPKLPEPAREVLTIRRQVSKKNSVAKYASAQACTSPDGRARGLLQYHAAHTGRWGGRLLQPQNMPKGFKEKEQAEALAAIKSSDVDGFLARYGAKSMDALSDALRGLFVAAPDKLFICADFNAIEARVLFWLAGEEDALAAYRRGESPYLDMARVIYKRDDLSKAGTPEEYDIGKRSVLGYGYQMGWKRFKGNIFTETAKVGKPVMISDELAQRSQKAYRTKYPRVKGLWYDMEGAAMNAVRDPGKIYTCGFAGRVAWAMSVDRRFLLCRLPSGRYLRYWKPEVRENWVTFCDDESCPHFAENEVQKCPKRQLKTQLCFWGEDSETHQWTLLSTYGGALVENVVQAIARDLMAHGMLNVQAAGFDVLLTVHDEVLAEILRAMAEKLGGAAAALKRFIELMCDVPVWASTCPVGAEGWTGERYHK